MLPQVEQTRTVSTAPAMAARERGEQVVLLLDEMEGGAAGGRGAEPGSFERSWISRSISGPVTERGMQQGGRRA